MATLRVWTHWLALPGSSPGAPLAPPASLAAYTPAPPRVAAKAAGPQEYSQDWATSPTLVVWAELARQSDIDLAAWGGPNWLGPYPLPWPAPPLPPVHGDEGYKTATAVAFRVTGVSVIMRNVSNNDFRFLVRDPANNIVGEITPASPSSSPGVYPVTGPGGTAISVVANGIGIWQVEIRRLTSVGEPKLYVGGPVNNPVEPTYVSPYGDRAEGILGIAFEGEEILCPTVKKLIAEVEVLAGGVAAWQVRPNLVGTNCVGVGQRVRFTAEYSNPTPPAGIDYDWDFGDSTAVTGPANSQVHTYATADVYAAAVSLKVPVCSTLLTKVVEVCYSCPTKVEIQPPPPQPPVVAGCAPGSATATFNVIVTWPSPPPVNPAQMDFTWVINGPTGKYEITTSSPNVSTTAAWTKISVAPNTTGPVDLGAAGSGYSVSVTVNVDHIRQGCTLVDTRQFTVPACVPCPQVSITAPTVQGCAEQNAVVIFTAQLLSAPGVPAPTGYRWVITHVGTGRQATVLMTTPTIDSGTSAPPWAGSLATTAGTVDLKTPGSYTARLTAEYAAGTAFPPGCDPTTTLQFTVPSCVAPPTVSSCSVTAGTPGTLTVTFDSPVDSAAANNPANYSVVINTAAAVTPGAGTTSYNAATRTTTISGLTLVAGDSVTVTVSNVTDPSGTVMLGSPRTSTCAVPGVVVTTRPFCAALLWAAIYFLFVGAIVYVSGCIVMLFSPQIGAAAETTGVVIHSIGVTLFLIWWIFCRLFTPCAVILAVRDFVIMVIGILAIVALIVGIVGIFLPPLLVCSAAAGLYMAPLGVVLAMLDWLAKDRQCLIVNPSPPAASSGALTGSDRPTRRDPSGPGERPEGRAAGLGDVIKRATSAVGFAPCASCAERARQLNAKFPFDGGG